jgi:hypothetical protein
MCVEQPLAEAYDLSSTVLSASCACSISKFFLEDSFVEVSYFIEELITVYSKLVDDALKDWLNL